MVIDPCIFTYIVSFISKLHACQLKAGGYQVSFGPWHAYVYVSAPGDSLNNWPNKFYCVLY